MQVINTNVMSLNSQRNLNETQSRLNTALERLSSGLRINSSKDDAAGLAISQRMTAQINGTNQAIRNANDGISYAQTADGALKEITNQMQRIRQLAVQSGNETNTASDRESLNNEVNQAIAEINRIAGSTQFNGRNILDGAMQNLTFQVGANAGQTIQTNGLDARGNKLGAVVVNTQVNGVSLGDMPSLTVTEGEKALLSTKGLDLTGATSLTGNITIDGQLLVFNNEALAGSTAAERLESFANLITDKIDSHVKLDAADFKVTVNPFESAIEIQNLRTDAVTITANLNNGTASTSFTSTVSTNAAAITVAAMTTVNAGVGNFVDAAFNGATSTWSFQVDINLGARNEVFKFNNLDTPTITNTTNLITALQSEINNRFADVGSAGVVNKFTVAGDTDALKITNNTLESGAVKISGVRANDGVAWGASNVYTNFNAGVRNPSGAVTATGGTVALTLGATGSLNVFVAQDDANARTAASATFKLLGAIDINLDAAPTNSYSELANFVREQMQEQLGIGTTQIGVSSTTNGLVFTVNDTERAFKLALSLTDNLNKVVFSDTLLGTEVPTLNEFFAQGNSVSFDTEINGKALFIENARSLTDVVNEINRITTETGVKANLTSSGSDIVFSSDRGQNFNITLEARFNGIDIDRNLEATVENNSRFLDRLSVLTAESAAEAITVLDYALTQVNSMQAEMGAFQNRTMSTIRNLTEAGINMSASRSRIQDADFAAETAELTRQQILQQAGVSMLAQANQAPNIVLSLLQ